MGLKTVKVHLNGGTDRGKKFDFHNFLTVRRVVMKVVQVC